MLLYKAGICAIFYQWDYLILAIRGSAHLGIVNLMCVPHVPQDEPANASPKFGQLKHKTAQLCEVLHAIHYWFLPYRPIYPTSQIIISGKLSEFRRNLGVRISLSQTVIWCQSPTPKHDFSFNHRLWVLHVVARLDCTIHIFVQSAKMI